MYEVVAVVVADMVFVAVAVIFVVIIGFKLWENWEKQMGGDVKKYSMKNLCFKML